MKITTINKKVCTQLREEMNKVIAGKLAEFGLEGAFKNATFDDSVVTFKCDIKLAGTLGKRDKELNRALNAYLDYLAIKCDVSKEYIANYEYCVAGEKYKLVGYNSKAPKYPLVIEKLTTGEQYKLSTEIITNKFPLVNAGGE